MTARPVLACRALTVELGGRRVLDSVALALHAGEMVAVAGPNGAGKTTLLRTLAGITAARAGAVEIDGAPVAGLGRRAFARRLAYLPQETHTEFAPTVRDVVALGRYAHLGPLRPFTPADRRAVDEAMERSDVAGLADRALPTLSGGERRRVHLARAIAQGAEILVLDEPTTALDIGHAVRVLDLLAQLAASGSAVLFSLHDVALAARGPSRAVLLDRGRIAADGAPADVLTGAAAAQAFGIALRAIGPGGAIVPA